MFENADGIGGGCGLIRLKPFFLSNVGIYKGDDKNPYIAKLPSDAEVDKAIATGSAKSVKDIIVLAVQSKVSCQEITKWMETILSKIRIKIVSFKADVDAANKLIFSIQEQIAFQQEQLKLA